MDLWILSKDFEPLGIVDTASSIIWANRFRQPGDFELYISASVDLLGLLQEDYMVTRRDDDMVGIIEKTEIVTDEENGDFLLVSGRCTRSILDRRIVWEQTAINGTVETGMRKLVTDAFISPSDAARKYDKLKLAAKHGYTDTMRSQYTGSNLLEVFETVSSAKNYGFKIPIKDGMLVLDFYKPVDRSASQSVNPRVVFSEQYDNLTTTTCTYDKTGYKNVVVVAGEGEGINRRRTTVPADNLPAGLDRRELYVDARDISSNDGEIAEDEYNQLLDERGKEALSEATIIQSMEGTVEPLHMYTYKQDYFLGDIVTVRNKYGVQMDTQVLEVVEVWDENGYTCTPTFG